MGLAEFLFWFSFFMIGYTYLGYPLLLFVWARLFPKKVNKAYITPEPMVSVVIAARSEAANIRSRIENLFDQDYPAAKLEIVVVSDGSTDSTVEEVKRIIDENHQKKGLPELKLIEIYENMGKPNALNIGVDAAKGEFIVFADARQKFNDVAIKELIANFNDPEVGSVSGELVFYEDSDSKFKMEMGIYWNFEKKIRKMESRIHSTAGATGAIYAIRKKLFEPIPDVTILDDVYVPMKIVFADFRNVFEHRAHAYDSVSKDIHEEKMRKIRTLVGNYQLLSLMPDLLNPSRNKIFFRYISHKFLRLFIPFAFGVFIVSAMYSEGIFYLFSFLSVILALILAISKNYLINIPIIGQLSRFSATFFMLNYFAFFAFLCWVMPGRKELW